MAIQKIKKRIEKAKKISAKEGGQNKIEIKISKNTVKTERVLIIGGGFAGVRAALNLLHGLKNVHIILIDKNPYHSYHPDYYEIATAVLNADKEQEICAEDISKLCETATIPYSKIFKKYKNIEFLQGKPTKIDFENSLAEINNKEKISYDWLIISAGSKSSFYGIPCLKELAYEFKTVHDALNIRNEICEIFAAKPKKEKIEIVIGGGGFSGTEIAGELVNCLKYLSRVNGRPRENSSIKIIEASPSLLSGASVSVRKKAEKRLKNMGVEIAVNMRIEKINPPKEKVVGDENFSEPNGNSKGEVVIKDNEKVPFDMLIWTAGVEASEIYSFFPKELVEKKFCVKTNDYLLAEPFKNVFLAGDIAYFINPKTKLPLPMTAQTAISEGKYAAYAIKRKIKNKKLKKYKPKISSFIVPLGGKYAIADFGIIKFSGFFAWGLKHIITFTYFLSILPFFEAVKLWARGMKIYIKNDKI